MNIDSCIHWCANNNLLPWPCDSTETPLVTALVHQPPTATASCIDSNETTSSSLPVASLVDNSDDEETPLQPNPLHNDSLPVAHAQEAPSNPYVEVCDSQEVAIARAIEPQVQRTSRGYRSRNKTKGIGCCCFIILLAMIVIFTFMPRPAFVEIVDLTNQNNSITMAKLQYTNENFYSITFSDIKGTLSYLPDGAESSNMQQFAMLEQSESQLIDGKGVHQTQVILEQISHVVEAEVIKACYRNSQKAYGGAALFGEVDFAVSSFLKSWQDSISMDYTMCCDCWSWQDWHCILLDLASFVSLMLECHQFAVRDWKDNLLTWTWTHFFRAGKRRMQYPRYQTSNVRLYSHAVCSIFVQVQQVQAHAW